MANAIYGKFKEAILQASSNSSMGGSGTTGVYASLIDTGTYTFSSSHQFYSSVVAGEIGTPQEIGTKTFTSGTFDGDDVTFTAVSGASVEAIVTYVKNAGANTTWRVVHYVDTGATGLPVTPNGGDITVAWNASGIFTISDARLKRDIQQIGRADNGLGIYGYRYAWERQRRVGLLAQDVERLAPHAVARMRNGFKAVDYSEALAA